MSLNLHLLQLARSSHSSHGVTPFCILETAAARGDSRQSSASGGQKSGAARGDQASPALLKRFHGAIRWEKPWDEIKEIAKGLDLKTLCIQKDSVNGNAAIHIAAQNGHLHIVHKLLAVRIDVNAQNAKGNTPLHMSVQYDFYFVSKPLLDSGGDGDLRNDDGHKAIEGIDGNKVGKIAWDNPVMILASASTREEFETAFKALEKATPDMVDKEKLVQTGIQKKKSPDTRELWDHQRFMAVAKKL